MRISDWSSDVCSSDLAALSGCGLVLGDIPTFRELWDGVASFAPPDDEERLHQALEGLAGDPVLLAARRRAARRRARSEERRVGKEGVSTGRSRGSQQH